MRFKFRTLSLSLLLVLSTASMANGLHGAHRGHQFGHQGWHQGGNHGRHYRGGHSINYGYYGGSGWEPVLLGSALIGSTVYLASRPLGAQTVIVNPQPNVIISNPMPPTQWVGNMPAPAPVEAYYCRDSGQYYPTVPTCVSPWVQVLI